jgi:hypothetical protein
VIVDRKIEISPEGIITMTNWVDPSALLAQLYEERQENAKLGGLDAKGFTPDRQLREIGGVTPSIMVAHPLLREGMQAGMSGNTEYASRCYKLFFNTNPLYRTSLGQV